MPAAAAAMTSLKTLFLREAEGDADGEEEEESPTCDANEQRRRKSC